VNLNPNKSSKKRLLFCNLKKAYQWFKRDHQEIKIGFSKFAMLRPKNIVLVGASGTHSICVCALIASECKAYA